MNFFYNITSVSIYKIKIIIKKYFVSFIKGSRNDNKILTY